MPTPTRPTASSRATYETGQTTRGPGAPWRAIVPPRSHGRWPTPPVTSPAMTKTVALEQTMRDLAAATADVAAAVERRDAADHAVDRALAAHGWTRLGAVISPDANPLYSSPTSGVTISRPTLVGALLRQEAAR